MRAPDARRNLVLQRNKLIHAESVARHEIPARLLVLEKIQIGVVARVERVCTSRGHSRMAIGENRYVAAVYGSLTQSMGCNLVGAVILRSNT